MTKTAHIPRMFPTFFTAKLRSLFFVGGHAAALCSISSLYAEPAAFEAFMEPLPVEPRSSEQAMPSEPEKKAAEQLFLVTDFDSPFHIAYEIDVFDTNLEARLDNAMQEDLFLVEGINALQPDSEEIALVEPSFKAATSNRLLREAKSMKNEAVPQPLPISEGSIWLENLSASGKAKD